MVKQVGGSNATFPMPPVRCLRLCRTLCQGGVVGASCAGHLLIFSCNLIFSLLSSRRGDIVRRISRQRRCCVGLCPAYLRDTVVRRGGKDWP